MDYNEEHTNQFESSPQPGAAPYSPQPGYRPPVTPAPKKRGLGGKIVALGLVCGLLGSLLGGGLVAAAMYLRADEPTEQTQIQQEEPQPQEQAPQPSTGSNVADKVIPNTGALTPAQVYAQNVASVVGISNEITSTNVFGQVSATASTGSGFIISADGYIITNYHVVSGAQDLKVSLQDGTIYPAELVGYEATNDVALLKIEATGLTPVTIGDSDTLGVGDCVAAIGNPLGELSYTMTVGYISAMDREINTDGTPINMLQTDAAINSGNSGGPLFDMSGNVVGITTAKYSGTTGSGTVIEGIGFAIPINDATRLIPDLQEYGYVTGQAYLGITVRDLDASTAELYSLPLGAYVLSVEPGSCSSDAGLVSGDIITALEDITVESYTDLVAALKNYRAGDTVTLTIYRAGQTVELTVTLDEKVQSQQPTAEQNQQPLPQQIPSYQDPFSYFFGN